MRRAGPSTRQGVAARKAGAVALAAAVAGAALVSVAPPGFPLAEARDRAMAAASAQAAAGLAGWLAASARAAQAEGVGPVPADVREALAGFVDDGTLERVRYRIGGGGLGSLHRYAFLDPRTRAVALDGVIVFRDRENALKPRYWVHEIVHLEQIRRWGLEGFARRYLADAAAVEAEAWAATERYVAWALRRELEATAEPAKTGRGGG
jgi:hypothetical protein